MKSTRSARSLLLLTMAAVASGRNATEYFQQARFQHSPSRPEDAVVFYTTVAPPLVCELEKDGDWIGGDRLKADLILVVPDDDSYYTCSFEGNATTHTNLQLIQRRLPGVFTSTGERKIMYSDREMYCITDSLLPDEYFDLRVQRPNEEHTVKCLSGKWKALYFRFPGYPTIICRKFSEFDPPYGFELPGIIGDQKTCGFQVYVGLRTSNKKTEKELHFSLVRGLPTGVDGRVLNVVCSRSASPNGTAHFQVRFPGPARYDCSFSDTGSSVPDDLPLKRSDSLRPRCCGSAQMTNKLENNLRVL